MESVACDHKNARVRTGERIAKAVLWPGEKVCDLIRIEEPESRLLLRIFINLTIYAKAAVIIALLTL